MSSEREKMGKTVAPGLGGRRKKTGDGPGKGRKGVTSLWQQGPDCWLLVTEEMGAGSRLGGRNQPKERSLRDPLLTPAGAV